MEIGAGFARAVWAALEHGRISQAELARRIGMPVRSLRRIMLCQVDVKLRHVATIADALGVHVADLVAEADRLSP